MTAPKPTSVTPPEDIEQLAERFQALERFITRRFDEVSAEIHATCQMVGMAEDGIEKRFAEILGVLGAVTHQGTGNTAPNIGVELGAVVKTTEDAAFQIIQSAEKIGDQAMSKSINWADPVVRSTALGEIKLWADDILVACAFQDLTGQRIAKTLENIRKAEEELSETLQKLGLRVDVNAAKMKLVTDEGKAQSQGDIDALFS